MLRSQSRENASTNHLTVPLRSDAWVAITVLPRSDSLKLGMQKFTQQAKVLKESLPWDALKRAQWSCGGAHRSPPAVFLIQTSPWGELEGHGVSLGLCR